MSNSFVQSYVTPKKTTTATAKPATDFSSFMTPYVALKAAATPKVTSTATPMGIQQKAPTVTQKPTATATSSSLGGYKGVSITPGDQANIQAQMAQIDANEKALLGSSGAKTSTTASSSNNSTNSNNSKAPSNTSIDREGLINQLVALQKTTSKEAGKTADEIAKTKLALQDQLKSNLGSAAPLSFMTGRSGQLQNQANEREQALQGQLSNQLGIANTQSGLLNNAINATAPVTQFGQLTNPLTGQVIGADSSGNNPMLTNAVQNAVNMVNSGGSYNDALSSLGSFGARGEQALIQALGGNVNPTAINTQASSNASNYATNNQAINSIDTTSKALDANISQMKDFAINGALDRNLPILSALRQKFGTNFANIPAVSGFLASVNNANTTYQQITGVSNIIDPNTMTVGGLDAVQQTMRDNIQNKKQNLLDQQRKAGGSTTSSGTSGGNLYSW